MQNPDIVLVHYLNVPYPDDNKLAVITPSLALWADKKEWTKDELVSQLKPMFYSEDEPDLNNELEISVNLRFNGNQCSSFSSQNLPPRYQYTIIIKY